MSTLVWSVESVILGLWALVFVTFSSSPFHTFIARSHLIVAGFTLFLQLYNSARSLSIGHAVSEAFVCFVSGLFLVYLMALLDPQNYSDPNMFSMPVIDNFIPLDACISIAWFCAVLVSSIGMALSEKGRISTLMFHHFGYHILIVPPSILVFWLYNYNATATEPVSQGISFFYHGARITHFIYTMVLIGIWGVFIVLQTTGECLLYHAEWPASLGEMTANGNLRYTLSVLLKLAGRAACVLIPISAAFTAQTGSQVILAWVLTGIGGLNSFDWIRIIDSAFKEKSMFDGTFTRELDPQDQPSAPPQQHYTESRFFLRHDPAALPLPRVARVDEGRVIWREKSV